MYVLGEDAEGIRVAKSERIECNYNRPVVELTEEDVYIDSDGYLVANPYDGAGRYEFYILHKDEEGNVVGELARKGVLIHEGKLKAAGLS